MRFSKSNRNLRGWKGLNHQRDILGDNVKSSFVACNLTCTETGVTGDDDS